MIKRRQFLKAIAAGSALVYIGAGAKTYASTFVSNEKLRALPAFLDTLIPEDITPCATQLNLHNELINHAKTIANYTELLELGCDWLNRQSKALFKTDFLGLDQAKRNRVVSIAAENDDSALLMLFFSRVRNDSFTFYYSHPASWERIGISRPIQPLGYHDFDKAPREIS